MTNQRKPKLYLAGPEVFLPNALAYAEQQKHFRVAWSQERQALEIVNGLSVLAALECEERQLIERFYFVRVPFDSLHKLLACLRSLTLLEP